MSDTNAKHSTAMIAGGCFWCVEADLKKLTGVHEVVSGYAGGDTKSPTYENYAAGGHREVVLVTYDAQQVSFRQLIIYAVKHMDPTDGAGSFGDRGKGYAPALYYSTATEKQIIEKVIEEIDNTAVYKAPLAVEVLEQPQFWPAESYHQGYHTGASSLQYRMYRKASGRDAFINEHWKNETGTTLPSDTATSDTKPTEEELQKMLTPLQFEVTQKDGTEPPFKNKYNNNKEAGLYVDVVSGEPLFTSLAKFESGTGWPSFTAPINPEAVTLHSDEKLWAKRTEVRSAQADSHLGHVFSDGPKAAGGLRYCLNSAALRFIPVAELEQAGYGQYKKLFTETNSD